LLSLLGGISLLPAMARAASTAAGALRPSQIAAVEDILRGQVESGIVPGVSYSIGNARETLAEGAFGLRRIAPVAAPMHSATRCALASVSKQFVAVGAYILRVRGLLSLDAPLSKYLPDYAHAREMTLHQVLTMRSGIPADDEVCEAPIDGRVDETTLIENLNHRSLSFKPGQHFAYSNCAYDVAGAVIARVAEMPYSRFVEQVLFEPLGMDSSYVLGSRNEDDFAEGNAPDGAA
jgi:D-alanyl-D-alanine carboxypeptidase